MDEGGAGFSKYRRCFSVRGLALVARCALALGEAGSGQCRQFNDSNGVRAVSNGAVVMGV